MMNNEVVKKTVNVEFINPRPVGGDEFDEEPVFRQITGEEILYAFRENDDVVDSKGSVSAYNCAIVLAALFPDMVFISAENQFFRQEIKHYCFIKVSEEDFMMNVLCFLAKVVPALFEMEISHKFNTALGKNIVAFFKQLVGKDDFFKLKKGQIILHLKNCFLVWEHQEFVRYPLKTDWIHSRKMLNVSYNPDAPVASRFMNELLRPVVSQDDAMVLLTYAAQCLLGYNMSQTILVIVGEAGTGKSVTVNIIEALLGNSNVTQLRTECLGGHFETRRYVGKSLLVGKDVPPDFLQRKGASVIKSLTGNDLLSTETKHSSVVHEIIGNFNVLITSNSSQPIAINDDRGAWERRVRIVRFKGSKPKRPIENFGKLLLESESEGIFLEILSCLKRLLLNGGHIEMSPEQRQSVENLLDESISSEVFFRDCVEAVEPQPGESLRKCTENLSSEEIYLSYLDYCTSRGWNPLSARKFQNQAVDLMPRLFRRFRVNDILRNGRNHRGYYAVRFRD